MARAAAQFVFAALLALLSAQAAVPSSRIVAAAEIVWCADTEQQPVEEIRAPEPVRRAQPSPAAYRSRVKPAPEAIVLFQRPPPSPSFFP
jgi:hypothetical protein